MDDFARRTKHLLEWLEKQRKDYADMVTDAGDSSLWCKDEAENIRDHIKTVEAMRDQIARAAAAMDDEYAALNQHLRGDGDAPTAGGRLIASAAEAAVAAWHTRALAAEAEVERLREALERIESASRHWAAYEAAPDAVHYAHESTARLARAALTEGDPA